VQRIVQRAQRIVAAIDGQRVLGQVVGADRDEVEVADQRGRAIAAAGTSIIAPNS
jgi:hypothetical protein